MKLGKSPSELTEFMQVKEQINYLNRQDRMTDWKLVKSLSEKLLLDNGTDLQTLVYLTVADYKIKPDFYQLTKNIELVAIALFSYWDDIWPQDITARVNLLNWLNRQLSEPLRASFSDKKDIKDCYSLVNSLSLITSTLKNKANQTSTLLYLLGFVNDAISVDTKSNLERPIDNFSIAPLPEKEKSPAKSRIETIKEDNAPPNIEHSEVLNIRKNQVDNPKKIKSYKSIWLNLLFFIIGVSVSSSFLYFFTKLDENKINKQWEIRLDSPSELVRLINISIAEQEDVMKLNLQNTIKNYVDSGNILIKNNTIKERLVKLQGDLLQAERKKQGVTISYLKTALYEIERELEQMNCLECDLGNYVKTPDNLALQKNIEHRFLTLLFYYTQLKSSKSELEPKGTQYDRPTSSSPTAQ